MDVRQGDRDDAAAVGLRILGMSKGLDKKNDADKSSYGEKLFHGEQTQVNRRRTALRAVIR
jgi:hypothetical protein